MVTNTISVSETPQVLYALRRADDALILGHRLSECCGHAPTLEEDMALANIGLDLIGQARALYALAVLHEPSLEGGRANTEDTYAYLRDVGQYRNLLLCELPNGDFGRIIMRQFLYSAFIDPYWRAMMKSSDAQLAAIAEKAEKETAYHLRYASEWVIRLGDGTPKSHDRMQAALEFLWSYTGEMFDTDEAEGMLQAEGMIIDASVIHDGWRTTVQTILDRATLTLPQSAWMQKGGRSGRHSEHLGFLLSEMQQLPRSEPGAVW